MGSAATKLGKFGSDTTPVKVATPVTPAATTPPPPTPPAPVPASPSVIVYGPNGVAYTSPAAAQAAGVSNWSYSPPAPSVPGAGALPEPLATTSGESRIDPALRPYLQLGLQRAQQLFLGDTQPSLYPGQMYVSPSEQTLAALQQQEALASQASPTLQQAQEAYRASLGQIGQTASGGFLQGSPYQEQMIAAATRPLTQQFSEQVIPGVSSLFSRAGRYGSGTMERALGTVSEAYGRALGDVTANIVGQDYARERQLQQQAQLQQAALAQAAPSFFQMGFLPSQTLAQVGAAREAIAGQPLQEAIQRYQYSQQLPYQQLQGFLSSVYGTPMGSSQYASTPQAQTNVLGQALGGGILGSQLGGLFSGFGGFSGSQIGAGLGALAGLL